MRRSCNPDTGHGGQDLGKRVRRDEFLDLFGDLCALLPQRRELRGQPWQHDAGGLDHGYRVVVAGPVQSAGQAAFGYARQGVWGSLMVAVGTALTGGPRTDPSVRDYRTGLLPRVRASKRTLGQGCVMRTGGSHRVARRFIRSQVRLVRWLRRRSARSELPVRPNHSLHLRDVRSQFGRLVETVSAGSRPVVPALRRDLERQDLLVNHTAAEW